MPLSLKRRVCSRLWNGLHDIWEDLKESVSCITRDGQHTDFWYNNWLGSYGRLVFECLTNTSPLPVVVSKMVTVACSWDWNRVRDLLPDIVLEHLVATSPPLSHIGSDISGWRWDEKREFRLNSTYDFLMKMTVGGGWRSRLEHAILYILMVAMEIAMQERNGVADKLASLGRQQTLLGVVLVVSSGAVADLVNYEQRRWGSVCL
ncbi:hypothetical protein V6N12_076407 [Hibiscus sabdariffa]|uniref:Uncharacterized protein n=1 Tax=Hibiscus sabdariffa TaxID=183260 RepID=A0ABR2D9Q2_9ROSI